MTTLKVFELPEEYLKEFKSEIIIIDTPCDPLSKELYEISIKKIPSIYYELSKFS